MANLKVGLCPSCGKERQLAYFKFGVVQATMCPFCMSAYLDRCVLPRLKSNNDMSQSMIMSGGSEENEQSDI